MSGRGIDYSCGMSNVCRETGIHYGVISINDLSEWAWESFEADYGPAMCGKCGNEALIITDDNVPDLDDLDGTDEEFDRTNGDDYACLECSRTFDASDAFGDEAAGHTLDEDGYKAEMHGDDNDIFLTKSPYYTRAAFCSPCAPGAGHLRNPCDDGVKTFAFGHSWFEGGKAPYPVFRVEDDRQVFAIEDGFHCEQDIPPEVLAKLPGAPLPVLADKLEDMGWTEVAHALREALPVLMGEKPGRYAPKSGTAYILDADANWLDEDCEVWSEIGFVSNEAGIWLGDRDIDGQEYHVFRLTDGRVAAQLTIMHS